MKTWWEHYPGRLEWELEALRKIGFDFELDEAERARGRIVLQGTIAVTGEGDLRIIIAYPDTYPHTRVSLYAPGLRLPRHQNPSDGNLCLLSRAGDAWRPSMNAALLLREDLPRLLALVRGDQAELRRQEDPQGEPRTEYYSYWPLGAVLVPQEALTLDRDITAGRLTICADDFDWLGRIGAAPEKWTPGWAMLTELRSRDGGTLATTPSDLLRPAQSQDAVWVRSPEPPPVSRPAELKRYLEEHAMWPRPIWRDRRGGGHVAVIGVVFSDEVSQGVWEDAWVFLVVFKGRRDGAEPQLLRGLRYSREDLAARIPELTPLAEKKIAVVGLGSIGAPIALELARAQVGELRLLDHDHVDPATSVRWPFGCGASGLPKAHYLSAFMRDHYRFVRTRPLVWRFGTAPPPGASEDGEREVLEALLDGADLLIDATAEENVSRALADVSREAGIPQIYVWGVDGHGGVASRHLPGSTGCYGCLEIALSPGGGITPPPAAADPGALRVQPRGCGDVTFAAANTELAPLATQAVRLAFGTLCRGEADAYPDAGSDVYVLRMREPDGSLVDPPSWSGHALPVDPTCRFCLS